MNTAEAFFTHEERTRIVAAIKEAEQQTSGEIRLYIENSSHDEVLDRAAYLFENLEMHKTALRNGVLFYLAVKSKKFAIIGDAGINAVVKHDFWDEIKEVMLSHFVNGEFPEGLCLGIKLAGEALRNHFPYHQNDSNELSDDIVFGK